MKNKQPHILLITTDQMRWDGLGCMGNPVIQTPNLDALAARGVLFRNGFTPNPICVPARASIMTGNYSHVCTGIKGNSGRIRKDQPLLTEVLKNVGYRTYAMGKLHFVPYSPPGTPRLVHGFEHVDLHESGRLIGQYDPQGKLSGLEDYFDYLKTVGWGGYARAHGIGNNDVRSCTSPLPQEYYVDRWIADCTIRQVDRHLAESSDRPFFMWMSSPKPHSPYDPPRPYDQMYDPRQMPKPFGLETDMSTRNPSLQKRRYTHAFNSLSPEAIQVCRSYYYGCITFLDAMVGRVMEHLKKKGLLEDTLILFTADHGDLLGDFGTFFKSCHQNGSVRVPFLAAGPGISKGQVSEAPVGLQDILPTFAAAAGTSAGQDVHGLNLMPHLADGKTPVRDIYYSQTGESPSQSNMVTDGKWKYIYSQANATEELYNLENDPSEEENLAIHPKHQERREEWKSRLREEALRLGDTKLLTETGFVESKCDRSTFKDVHVSGMGWRWY